MSQSSETKTAALFPGGVACEQPQGAWLLKGLCDPPRSVTAIFELISGCVFGWHGMWSINHDGDNHAIDDTVSTHALMTLYDDSVCHLQQTSS